MPHKRKASSGNGSSSRKKKTFRSSSRRRLAATRIQNRLRTRNQIRRNLEIDNECPICLENMIGNQSIIHLECGHRFHTRCFERYLRGQDYLRCPLCRTQITNNDYDNLHNPNFIHIRQALNNRQHCRNEVDRLSEELLLITNNINTINNRNSMQAQRLYERLDQIMEERNIALQNLEEARHEVAHLEGIPLPGEF
jgi:hypothetical protein